MHYEITLKVWIDHSTTRLTAEQHKSDVSAALVREIGRGLLTEHDPEAVVDEYAID